MSFIRLSYIFIFFLIISPKNAAAEEDLFLLQLGYEDNQVELKNKNSSESVGSTGENPKYTTDSRPLFSIASKIYFSDYLCLGGVGDATTSKPIAGCMGFGLRFGGAQKRHQGEWFSLTSESASTNYYYDSNQITAEILLGALAGILPVISVGLKGGYNNYDLLVTNNNSILINDTNKSNYFLSTTYYINVVVLIDSLFGLWPHSGPFSDIGIELSLENTLEDNNTIKVDDINTGHETKVDMAIKTGRITIQVLF